MKMAVYHHSLSSGDTLELGEGLHAIAVLDGSVFIGGKLVEAGDGGFADASVSAGDEGAEIRLFSVGETLPDGAILIDNLLYDAPQAVLRLDQITFPPGAIAYRHHHAGAGIRSLIRGQLEIVSDHHTEMMTPGSAWFEDFKAPVRANASQTEETAFVRTMILPMEYLGKPTITYLNDEDADKPRLQTNHRFFDKVVDL